MKKILLILMGLCCPLWAHAVDYYWAVEGVAQYPTYRDPTPDGACTKGLTAYGYQSTYEIVAGQGVFSSPTLYSCRTRNKSTGTTSTDVISVTRYGDGCTAPATYNASTGICEKPACTAGRVFEATFPFGKSINGKTTTDMQAPSVVNGCQVSLEAVVNCQSMVATGDVYCRLRLKETGQTGTGSTTPTTPPTGAWQPTLSPNYAPPTGADCPAGTVGIGWMAGKPMCAGQGTSPQEPSESATQKPTTTTNNADGSTTKTQAWQRTNADGSTTTTTRTTTTKPDGTTETKEETTTGNTPGGLSGKPDEAGPVRAPAEDGKEQDDFCKKNPTLTVCKNSTISGNCENTNWTGDALMGEIAKQTRIANCKRQAEIDEINASPLKTLGDQLVAGNDPLKGQFPTSGNGSTVNIGTSLDSSAWLAGGGSCLADDQLTVMGRSVTLPWSSVCEHLDPMRYAMLIIAALLSLRMVSRSLMA